MANIINPYKEKYDKAKASLLKVKGMKDGDKKTKALGEIKKNQKNFLDLNKNYNDWNAKDTQDSQGYTDDNRITNALVDAGKLPESYRENVPQMAPNEPKKDKTNTGKRASDMGSNYNNLEGLDKGIYDRYQKAIDAAHESDGTIKQPKIQIDVKGKNGTEQSQNTPQKGTVTNPELSKSADYNKSKERIGDIYSNLNKFYEQDKDIINDEKTFMEDYGVYRPDGSLKSQSEIDAVKNWYSDKQRERKVMGATNQDIIDGIKTGEFSNDDLEKLRELDPEKYAAIKNQQEIIQQQQKFETELNGQEKTKTNTSTNTTPQLTNAQLQAQTEANLFKSIGTPKYVEEYNNAINSDTIKANQSKLNEVNLEIEELNKAIKKTRQDVEAEFPGLPRSAIEAITADRTQSQMTRLDNLISNANKYSADINSEVKVAERIYETAKAEEERQRKDKAEKIDFYKWKMNKEDYAKQREVDYQNFIKKSKYAEGDINSKDPDMRKKGITKAVQGILKEYNGLPFQRSEQEIIAGVEKEMAEGKTASQALSSVMDGIRENTMYEEFVNKRLGIEEPELIVSLGGNAFMKYDKELGRYGPIQYADGGSGSGSGGGSSSGGSGFYGGSNNGDISDIQKENSSDMPEGLSSLAQEIWINNSGIPIGIGTVETKALLKELTEAGYNSRGKGNTRFLQIKPDNLSALQGLITFQEDLDDIIELKKKVDLGDGWIDSDKSWKDLSGYSIDPLKKGLTKLLHGESEDKIALNQLAGDKIVRYVKEISGAQVSDKEYDRLSDIQMNTSMTNKEFDIAVKNAIKDAKQAEAELMRKYGFKDIDSLYQALGKSKRNSYIDSNTNSTIDTDNIQYENNPKVELDGKAMDDVFSNLVL